jgi:4-carboxymuconolactone decarboxylase
MKKVTAGRDALNDFAPEFARYNDDVLFGEVWSRTDQLPLKERSLITVSALLGAGILDSSLQYHLQKAKENGVSKEEMAEVLTQLSFYVGWPKAWAAFRLAKEIYKEEK